MCTSPLRSQPLHSSLRPGSISLLVVEEEPCAGVQWPPMLVSIARLTQGAGEITERLWAALQEGLTLQVWGRTGEYAFLTDSQGPLRLLLGALLWEPGCRGDWSPRPPSTLALRPMPSVQVSSSLQASVFSWVKVGGGEWQDEIRSQNAVILGASDRRFWLTQGLVASPQKQNGQGNPSTSSSTLVSNE